MLFEMERALPTIVHLLNVLAKASPHEAHPPPSSTLHLCMLLCLRPSQGTPRRLPDGGAVLPPSPQYHLYARAVRTHGLYLCGETPSGFVDAPKTNAVKHDFAKAP